MRRIVGWAMLSVAACAGSAPALAPHADVISPPLGPFAAPPPASPLPPPAPPKIDRCPAPPPGSVSEDDSPILSGVGPGMPVMPWLEARGVSRATALAWYRGRYGVDKELAEGMFGNLECNQATLGDDAEEAAVCETEITYSWMQIRAFAIVVRKGRLTPVLDVGLGMRALDWPDSRHLDLALSFSPDGRSATLRDRAPDGTRLVEAPSVCRARETTLDKCEDALANHAAPEGFCPFVVDDLGHRRVARGRDSLPMMEGLPTTLHDCAQAKSDLKSTEAEMSKQGGWIANEAHVASRFIQRTCNEVGIYVWKNGRFVLQKPPR